MLGVFKGKLGLICFLFISTGPGVLDYTLHTEEHKCKKDALLGRIKHLPDKTWKLIRPRPTKTQYVGPYYICKGNIYECVNSLAQKLPLYKCYKKIISNPNTHLLILKCYLCCFRGGCWKRVPVPWPLYICILPGRDWCLDSGAKRVHLQRTALRSLRAQLQCQVDCP